MLPLRLALFPELLRNLLFVVLAVALQWPASQDPAQLAQILACGLGSAALTPLAIICCVDVPLAHQAALEHIETCPRFLRPQRNAAVAYYESLRDSILGPGEPPLLERLGLVVFGLRILQVVYGALNATDKVTAMVTGARELDTTLLLVLAIWS